METLRTYLKARRGNLTGLAKALEITPAAIKQWEIVPADKLVAIEGFTGIPRQTLRPDLYEGMRRAPRARAEAAQ